MSTPTSRGEVTMTFNGVEVTLRPEIHAIMKLESTLGKSLVKLATTFAKQDPTMTDVVHIIWAGLLGGGVTDPSTNKPYTVEAVGRVVLRDGLFIFMVPAANFLSGVMSGGKGAEQVVEGKA